MVVLEVTQTAQRAPAKGRILEVASHLFYSEGIRAVGVDRIIGASAVTKATFYKHYRAKENLIVIYISARHYRVRADVEALVENSPDSRSALINLIGAILAEIAAPGFRGCPFINAAMEYPDATHPVRSVVTEHREWYVGVLTGLLRDAGHPAPGDGADEFVLAHDGAMAGGLAGDSIAASAAFGRIAGRVISPTG